MGAKELKDRTKRFALRVLNLCSALPRTTTGRRIGDQLVRSGTAVGANYRSACRARSNAEFIAKLGVVLEEADETSYWLELIMDGKLLNRELVESLHKESEELCAMFYSSIQSSKQSASGK